MPQPPRDQSNHPNVSSPYVDLEPGWRAAQALMRAPTDALLALMLRPSFRPTRDLDLTPVYPCLHCLDGGIRTAGTIRSHNSRIPLRACDTCGIVILDAQHL